MTFFFLVKKNDSTAIISIISSFSDMHSKGREVYSEAGKTEEREWENCYSIVSFCK